jgi:hypothetical protein
MVVMVVTGQGGAVPPSQQARRFARDGPVAPAPALLFAAVTVTGPARRHDDRSPRARFEAAMMDRWRCFMGSRAEFQRRRASHATQLRRVP